MWVISLCSASGFVVLPNRCWCVPCRPAPLVSCANTNCRLPSNCRHSPPVILWHPWLQPWQLMMIVSGNYCRLAMTKVRRAQAGKRGPVLARCATSIALAILSAIFSIPASKRHSQFIQLIANVSLGMSGNVGSRGGYPGLAGPDVMLCSRSHSSQAVRRAYGAAMATSKSAVSRLCRSLALACGNWFDEVVARLEE